MLTAHMLGDASALYDIKRPYVFLQVSGNVRLNKAAVLRNKPWDKISAANIAHGVGELT